MIINNFDSIPKLQIIFADSIDINNPIQSINSNSTKINFKQSEGPVSEIIKENTYTNQIYNQSTMDNDSEEQFTYLSIKPSLSKSLEEENYDKDNENENDIEKCITENEQFTTDLNQSQAEAILGVGISPEKNEIKIKKKLGRPSKLVQNKGLHTRQSKDNAAKVFIQRCSKNLHEILQNEIKTLIGKKRKRNQKKINGKLHVPTINNYLIKKNEEKIFLFNSSIKEIYYNTRPKRVPDKLKKEKDKYCYNKNVLEGILTLENENEQIEIKELNMKFNAEFILYLKAFLNNRKYIIIDGIKLELENFQTLSDCFNEGGEKGFSPGDKIIIKNYIYELIEGKLTKKNITK